MKSIIWFFAGLLTVSCAQERKNGWIEKERLGKQIFFDETLSEPSGQSCATCHAPEKGFADTYSRITSEGAVKGLFSNRNSMTCAYSAYVPALHYDEDDETYVGGLFWDGHANTLEEQAALPFVNPLEMGNKDAQRVVDKAKQAAWYPEMIRLYGETASTDSLFSYLLDALAVYEKSEEMNPFSSKYDAWLAGECELTEQEEEGMELFEEKGQCAECHRMKPDKHTRKVLFTDHTYDNLGIPSNPENPYFSVPPPYNKRGRDTVDLGLGSFVNKPAEYGKFRVPTLRNIVVTAPYGHNGYFKTLEDIVHFYNVRDIEDFPPAEYAATVNTDELGNLKLTAAEEAALIAFMKTLTDGYQPD